MVGKFASWVAVFGLWAGPAWAACPCWRADVVTASALPSIGYDRKKDGYLHIDLEAEMPLWGPVTGAIRGIPVYTFDPAGEQPVWGAGFGILNRVYLSAGGHGEPRPQGWYTSIGVSTVWSTARIPGNASRLNFLSQALLGFAWPQRNWHVAGGIEHMSNAGTAEPNHGVNGLALSIGFTL